MYTGISSQDLDNRSYQISVDRYPDQCPICHRSIQPTTIGWFFLREQKRVQGVFRCVNRDCQHLFIGEYTDRGGTFTNWHLDSLAPHTAEPVQVPPEVAAISRTFVEIRNQVAAAEALGLNQLVGMGLRKALEFLVKDFAVSEHPADKEAILKMYLGPCIDTYIPDGNIKACAKRAVWLGNDETHYLRKWTTHDVNALKELVRLTVNWIDNHFGTQRFMKEMPEGKK